MTEKEERARHAQALLDDPLLSEAFENLRQEKIAAWANSAPDNPEHRERAYSELKALEAVIEQLKAVVRDHAFHVKKGQHRNGD